MPLLREVIGVLDAWYPPSGADSWDAVGLVVGSADDDVRTILLAIDAVPATVDEAERVGADLLFTHHPLLLSAVHGVPSDDPKGALVTQMIRSSIAHFVAHSNAEVARPGVSDGLADALGLIDVEPLERLLPGRQPEPDERGVGRIGTLPASTTLAGFVETVSRTLPATLAGVRAAGDPDRPVRRVALLAGSGSSLVDLARSRGADVYLTADLKHHHALEAVTQRAGPSMALVDVSHWASERPWLDALAVRLRERFGATVDVVVSESRTDPWTLSLPPEPESRPPTPW